MKRIASLLVCLVICLTACTGGGSRAHAPDITRGDVSHPSPVPTPPGVITKSQLTTLGRTIATARSRKEADYVLATAQAVFYNCTLTAVYAMGSFQGLVAQCGGQHFTAGGERPK